MKDVTTDTSKEAVKRLSLEVSWLAKTLAEERIKHFSAVDSETYDLQQRLKVADNELAALRAISCEFIRCVAKFVADENDRVALIKKSGIVDEKWYLEIYQDVAHNNIDPVSHYAIYGIFEGRHPNSLYANV